MRDHRVAPKAKPNTQIPIRGSARNAGPRPVIPDNFPISQVVDTIVTWYRGHARPLPWRRPGIDAYGVLVCEVMSQQTPIARVLPKWHTWMERWPTPAHLAHAPLADILTVWQGLGYPRRARNLQRAAQAIVEKHNGTVPCDPKELESLPGVGTYTAGAVAAFAYGERTPVIDTNVRRTLARLVGGVALPGAATRRIDRERAVAMLPAEAETAARWSAAIMEFGALVCTSRAPLCEDCPVAWTCRWLQAGAPAGAEAARPRQKWNGTDRQLRGRVMALLCDHAERGILSVSFDTVAQAALDSADDTRRAIRIVNSLAHDGLVCIDGDRVALPG